MDVFSSLLGQEGHRRFLVLQRHIPLRATAATLACRRQRMTGRSSLIFTFWQNASQPNRAHVAVVVC